MTQVSLLADIGNIGLLASATAAVGATAAYGWLARPGGPRPPWWHSPFGIHLMFFTAVFAWVLTLSVIHVAVTTGLIVHADPPGRTSDWFEWLRVGSFAVLVPVVLAWRLWIVLWPPGRKDP